MDLFFGFSIVFLILPLMFLFTIWWNSMFFNVIKAPSDISLSYVKEFSNISLTLFGFTLIGGIFSQKGRNLNKDKKAEKRLEITKGGLLFSSILFLFSFILLNLFSLIVYPTIIEQYEFLIVYVFTFGFLFFWLGLLYLMILLIAFFISRYTTIPKRIDRWKRKILKYKIKSTKQKK